MAAVMIGVDPHKASHTAVAISAAEEPLGELRVRACTAQAERLLAWSAAWPARTWAVEGAGGLGHLLAQQLLAAGERVLDVPPKLGARVKGSQGLSWLPGAWRAARCTCAGCGVTGWPEQSREGRAPAAVAGAGPGTERSRWRRAR